RPPVSRWRAACSPVTVAPASSSSRARLTCAGVALAPPTVGATVVELVRPSVACGISDVARSDTSVPVRRASDTDVLPEEHMGYGLTGLRITRRREPVRATLTSGVATRADPYREGSVNCSAENGDHLVRRPVGTTGRV